MLSPKSNVSSQTSLINVSSRPTLDLDDSDLIEPLSTDPLIEKAVSNGTLKISSNKRIQDHMQKFKANEKITAQYIIGDTISLPRTDWEFTFNIYIPWNKTRSISTHSMYSRRSIRRPRARSRSRSRHHSHHRSMSATFIEKEIETVYVFTTFRAKYTQIQKIDNTIIKRMSMGYKYFAMSNEKYPSINKSKKYESIIKKRGEITINEMKKEEEFISKPKLPNKRKGWFGGTKSANYKDLELLATYLNQLFSSPSLMKTSFIYEELGFPEDLTILLRSLASNHLEAWHAKANQRCIRDPSKLKSWGTGDEYEFHTVYIVRRPLNDQSLSLFNFNHWALKFEGMCTC